MAENYDLFVSYAHLDNEDGWVSGVVNRLRMMLAMHAGRKISVFFDPLLNANDRVNDITDRVRASNLFLAIGSPAYTQREWTRRELETFWEAHKDPSRMFIAERRPLLASMSYPKIITDHIRTPLYRYYEERELHCEYPVGNETLDLELQGLAKSIVAQLSNPGPAGNIARSDDNAGKGRSATISKVVGKTVLLAQSSEALDDEHTQVRAFLKQQGIRVLPETEYPQGAGEFKEAFLMDLSSADLFVQLLDRRKGRCPPDMEVGYQQFQADAARENSVDTMQWRDQRIIMDEVHEEHRHLLDRETVMACGLEEFKQSLLKQAKKKVPADKPRNGAVVFIGADQSDFELARKLSEACKEHNLVAMLPNEDPDRESDGQRDLRESLETSKATVYLYGNAKVDWVRAQVRFFIKTGWQMGLPIVIGTPPPTDKPKLNISIPGAVEIESEDEEEFIQSIIEKLSELAA